MSGGKSKREERNKKLVTIMELNLINIRSRRLRILLQPKFKRKSTKQLILISRGQKRIMSQWKRKDHT